MGVGGGDGDLVAVRHHTWRMQDHTVNAGRVHLRDQVFAVEVRDLSVDRSHRGVDPDVDL